MRADRSVKLRLNDPGKYNPKTGTKQNNITNELTVVANISNTGKEQQLFLYGKAMQQAITVRLNFRLAIKVNEVVIDEETYKIERVMVYRHKTVIDALKR